MEWKLSTIVNIYNLILHKPGIIKEQNALVAFFYIFLKNKLITNSFSPSTYVWNIGVQQTVK